MNTNKIVRAYEFAADRHRDHLRYGEKKLPYISHLCAVATMLAMAGASEDQIIAGILHDSVEDVGVTLTEITELFGPHVAQLVDAVTEDKTLSRVERKMKYCEKLRSAGPEAILISASDWIANCESAMIESNGTFVFPPGYTPELQQIMTPVFQERFSVIEQALGDHQFVGRLRELLSGIIN